MDVMPTLGRVDAVDNADAVVYTEKHEESAKRQRRSPEESGTDLGAASSADHGSLCQRRHVAGRDGSDVRSVSAGLPKGHFPNGDTVQGAGQVWGVERQVHRRDAIDAVPPDGCQGQMQPLRGDGSTSHSPQGPQPHQQRDGELGSYVQPLPHEPSQDRVVALPKGWAILTDPPYGIGAEGGTGKYGRIRGFKGSWDSDIPDLTLLPVVPSIIWGGNYFPLRPSRGYLIWDKGAGFKGRDFAECEMAWCSMDMNARVLSYDPLARGDYRGGAKQHPTQKPVPLMQWCLLFLPDAKLILDPFMGSGTTGVA